jgi:hypothetical protein
MMNRKILLLLAALGLLGALITTSSAFAMNSPNYRLDWFVPLSGTAGNAESANYAVQYTVGQTVVGNITNTNNWISLGFWPGITGGQTVYMPIILRYTP